MPSQKIGAFEAKTRLSELLEQVSRGRTFLITRRGRPIAELRPVAPDGARLTFGCDAGRVRIAENFDTPLADMAEYER
jgi:prevent-host-death family protein